MVDYNNKSYKKRFKRAKRKKERSQGPAKKAVLFVWKKIKNTLFWAIVKACLLIFGLTYFIFVIKPSQAHVSASFSELDSFDTSFTAGLVTLKSQDYNDIAFSSSSNIRIGLMGYKIKDETSWDSNDCWLVIYPDTSDGLPRCSVKISGEMKNVRLTSAISDNLHSYSIHSALFEFLGSEKLEILAGRAVIETFDGNIITELESDSFNLVPVQPNKSSYNQDIFEKYLLTIVNNAVVGFDPPTDPERLYNNDRMLKAVLDFSSGELIANNVKSFKSTITGKLALSFTPTPREYDLSKQELVLESKIDSWDIPQLIDNIRSVIMRKNTFDDLIESTSSHSELELEYNIEHIEEDDSYKSKGVLYGYVSKGEVSKMSLFPAFKTWFYSNAYLTPTAIVAIVLSAIAIFNKKKGD